MDGATALNGYGWLASLGVGGVLAGGVFLFYRRDFLRERRNGREQQERLERREDRLLAVLERTATSNERLAGTMDGLERAIREKF